MIEWSMNSKAIKYDIDRILVHIAFNRPYRYRASRVPYGFVAVLNRFISDFWNGSNSLTCPICGMKHGRMYTLRNHVLYSHRDALMDAVNMMTEIASYIEAVCIFRNLRGGDRWICLECGFRGSKDMCVEHVLERHAGEMYSEMLRKWKEFWVVGNV